MTMVYRHSKYSTNKVEVGKMVRVDVRVWVDLQSVNVLTRILENKQDF